MKPNFFHKCAVLGVGAALLFTATSTRADEPKRKHHRSTEKSEDDQSVTPAKAEKTGGQIATRDGKHSTSANGGQTGGANGQETRVPTGSQIPQTYHRKAYTTDRSDSTFIYDKNDQRLRSTNNVGDSLRSVPGVTVGGSR